MEERLKILLIAGLTLFSFYYAYDIPGALNHNLEFDGSGNKETKIGLLYSAYAVPNIVAPLFFSHLTKFSKFGVLLCLSTFVFTGQVIFTFGAILKSFTVMIIGRIIFGMGCESYSVIQNRIITDYFKVNELSTAMSAYNACGRLGTILNFIITPLIVDASNTTVLCVVGCILVGISVRLCYTEYKHSKNSKKNVLSLNQVSIGSSKTTELKNSETLMHNPTHLWKAQAEYLSDRPDIFNSPPGVPEDRREVIGFHPSFKTLAIICFLFGMIWAPFYNIAPMMYQKRFGMSKPGSSRMLSCVEGITMLLAFIVSPLADKYGYKLVLVFVGNAILSLAHLAILLLKDHPYYSVILLGISYPFISSHWPCITKLVDNDCLSYAFAILYCALNLAFTISPVIVSYLLSTDPSYIYVEFYMLGLIACAFCFILLLSYQNLQYELQLNKPE